MTISIPEHYIQMTYKWAPHSVLGSLPATVLGVWVDEDDPDYDPSAFAVQMASALLNCVSADWALDGVTLRVGQAGGPPYPSFDLPLTVAGQLTAQAAPPNVAMLFQKRSFTGGRANRGRIYLPGLPDDEVNDDGYISNDHFALMQTAASDFDALAGAGNGLLGHVILHPIGSPLENSPTVIATHQAQGIACTQRRRQRR